MKLFFIVIFLIYTKNSLSEEKVIYKYKEYESIDLGGLEIKGNIVAPGDISVKERERKEFSRELLERPTFDQEILQDIANLR